MKEFRMAGAIMHVLLKDSLRYTGKLFADAIIVIARCAILLMLYQYVFAYNGGLIEGVSFQTAAWSMFFYFSLMTLRLRDIARLMMEDVKTGQVEILLSKPVVYLLYRMWWQIGAGLYSFLVLSLLGGLILGVAIGVPEVFLQPLFWPQFLLVLLACIVLSLFIYSIIGLLSFWMEDITPLYWVVDKAIMMLGGSYLPVALFPPLMYALAKYSPFGASQFVSHVVYANFQQEWWVFLGIQAFWIALVGGVLLLMFARVRKKVSVNGG